MIEQDKKILENRLNNLINEYQTEVKNLNDLQWKILRKRNEIETICKKLGLEIQENENNKQ